jgi:hypothetical protein
MLKETKLILLLPFIPVIILLNALVYIALSELFWFWFPNSLWYEAPFWFTKILPIFLFIVQLHFLLKFVFEKKKQFPVESSSRILFIDNQSPLNTEFPSIKCIEKSEVEAESVYYFSKFNLLWIILGGILLWVGWIWFLFQEIVSISNLWNREIDSLIWSWILILLWIIIVVFLSYFLIGKIWKLRDTTIQLKVNKDGLFLKNTNACYTWNDIAWEVLVLGKNYSNSLMFLHIPTNTRLKISLSEIKISKSEFQRVFATHRARSDSPYYHFIIEDKLMNSMIYPVEKR